MDDALAMSQTKAIAIIPAERGFKITIPGDAERWKAEALAKAAIIVQVTNAEEQQLAIQAAAVLKGLSQTVEADRVEIKDPYYKACKAIDAKAKEFVADIDSRTKEIEALVGDFQRKERDRVLAQQREEERQRREAEAAVQREQQRLADLERQRQAAERQAEQAKTAKARAAAQAEADRIAEEKAQAEIDAQMAQDDLCDAQGTTVVEEPAKAKGASIRFEMDYEVTDIEAFCRWDMSRRSCAEAIGKNLPSFVKIEVARRDFKQFINLLGDAELDSIPGMKFIETTQAAAKSVAPQIALQ